MCINMKQLIFCYYNDNCNYYHCYYYYYYYHYWYLNKWAIFLMRRSLIYDDQVIYGVIILNTEEQYLATEGWTSFSLTEDNLG